MNYTTYLFDFDYTLADSSRGIVTCFRNVLTHHGYTEVTDEAIKRTIGKTLEESFSILTGVTDEAQLAAFKAEYRKEADVHMTPNTMLFLETKSVLIALKDSGARIGIISTKYRFRIKELLDQHFPADFMDIIVGGEDVEHAKPSPEGLLLAIKRLHVSKADTLYIGDSTVDAETAQAAGVDFAGVTHGVTSAKELGKYPHRKIMASLEELLDAQDPADNAPAQAEHPIMPVTESAKRREKKRIGVWQVLPLLFLGWLAIEEQDFQAGDYSFFFPTLFLLSLWAVARKRRMMPKRMQAFVSNRLRPYTVRMRALHIKLIRGQETPAMSDKTYTCQNCGTTYTGNYCNRCGQSSDTPRYRLSNALRNIAGGFFNIDSGFGRTLIDLLHRPGYLIRDFIGGKRIQYFRPFQTLFILTALYIMVVQLVDPAALKKQESTPKPNTEQVETQTDKLIRRQVPSIENDSLKGATADAQKTAAEEEEEDAFSSLIDNAQKGSKIGTRIKNCFDRLVSQSPFLKNVCDLLVGWVHGNKAFLIIATLPLFAVATQLAFRRRKYRLNYNTTEHIFIQAYIACQIVLISILLLPFNGHASVDDLYDVPWWCIFLLFCWDYKQLYRCTWWKSFWRTVLMFTYSLLIVIAVATLAVALAAAVFKLSGG